MAWIVAVAWTGDGLAAEASRVYVEFAPGQKESARGLIERARGRIHHEFDGVNAVATTLPAAALTALRNNPNVVRVEDDPPRYLLECNLPTENYPYGVDLVQAPDVWDAGKTGAGIKVGVIDSGVFAGHTDFGGLNLSGYPGGVYPAAWNTDRNGHGTHVTGTIAAAMNGSGVIGVSPGVGVYMVKVFDDAGGWIYSSTLLNAAQRCQSAGCKIISMSLGGPGRSIIEDRGFQQIYNSGVLLVAAAGNAGDTSTSYPAGYSSVISVAAVDAGKNLASFSQRNSDVELAAPGVGVLSTVPYCEVNTVTASAASVSGNHVEFAGRGTVTAELVDGGLGDATNPTWSGKIVLVQRGAISFYDKVLNVQSSGGLACVIYNNVEGELYATLGTGNAAAIPAIGLSLANGDLLLQALGTQVTLTSEVTYEQSAWAYYDGTSMATPHVSAVAALIWSAAPTKSNADVRKALQVTAEDLGAAGRDTSFGFGLVRAKAALDYLAPSGGDTTPPVISGVTSSIVNAKKGTFKISWNTNEPATTAVVMNGQTYSNGSLVTSHSMTFQGTKGAKYTFYVQSADAAGNLAQAGPFTHQN